MTRIATIELSLDSMSFSAGHFIIFSSTERERVHGHNYKLSVALSFPVNQDGLSFNCQTYIEKLSQLCARFDRVMLLPTESRHLRVEEASDYYQVYFGQEQFSFLRDEVLLLPVANISMEELSWLLLQQFTSEQAQMLATHEIKSITLKIYSAPGICASAIWNAAG